MRLMKFIYIAVVFFAPCAYGEIISEKNQNALKLGIDEIMVSGPDNRSEVLSAMGIAWHTPWSSWLRQTTKLSYLSDYTSKSKSMNVYHEVYQFNLGVELVQPWLFRWHIAGGPIFIKEKVHYDIKTDEGPQRHLINTNGSGSFIQVGVDYAFNEDMECSFILGRRSRSSDQKSDAYYGVAMVWNIFMFWREKF